MRYPFCTAFTPDRKQLFVLNYVCDERAERWVWVVEKWDTTSGRKVPFPLKPIETVFPAGNILVSTDGRTLCLQTEEESIGVDASSGKTKYTVKSGFGWVSVSPDGRTGALIGTALIGPPIRPVGSPPESTGIAFWNFDDGTKQARVKGAGPDGLTRDVSAFSRDSRFFVLATGKGRIHVIDVKNAEVRASYTEMLPVKSLCLLTSGEIAAVGTEPKAVVIWKFKTP